MTHFSFQLPSWYLLLCFGLALAGTILLYYKSRFFSNQSLARRLLLALLRFLSLFLLAGLLLNPLIKRFKKDIRKPILYYSQDNSRSLIKEDSSWLTSYIESRESFFSQLKDKYDIQKIEFDSKTKAELSDSWNGMKTDLSGSFEYIQDHADLQHVKAIVLFSDGIYNTGKNPYYNPLVSSYPVYSIMAGDSIQDLDLAIQRIFHNDIIYSGDKFSTQIDIQAWNLENKSSQLTLEKFENQQWSQIQSFPISIRSDQFFETKELVLDAPNPGVFRFRAVVRSVSGEKNTRNNSKEFFIEVLDAKKKILLLCNSPHPDITAVKDALLYNKNYELLLKYVSDPVENLAGYSLVILHQVPDMQSNSQNWLTRITALKIPMVFILGTKSNVPLFNSVQDVVTIKGGNASMNESLPEFNTNFKLFTLSDGVLESVKRYPPLSCPFGSYLVDPDAYVMFKQKIGKISTEYPLVICSNKNDKNVSFILGEGLWKWRFNDFVHKQQFTSFYEIISKLIQFTSTKEDKRKFKISQNKRIFDENEPVIFNAELYNDNYERINAPDVKIDITKQDGTKYNYLFSKKDNFYELNVSSLPSGDYQYISTTLWNGKELKATGSFSVQALDFENSNLTADWQLMRSLAEKSNGMAFTVNQFDQLTKLLLNDQQAKPIIYQNQEVKPLLENKWLFLLIFLLLGLEWFLRRLWGSY